MISHVEDQPYCENTGDWQEGFQELLPAILDFLSYRFRFLPPEERTDAIQDCTVHALRNYISLHRQSRTSEAYPTTLARFAVARYFSGRRSTEAMRVTSVLSSYAQERNGFCVHSLGQHDQNDWWRESLLEDKRATPADTAAARLDFEVWISSLSSHDQDVVAELSSGATTRETAAKFQLSPGRISQKRRLFRQSWEAMHEMSELKSLSLFSEPDGFPQDHAVVGEPAAAREGIFLDITR